MSNTSVKADMNNHCRVKLEINKLVSVLRTCLDKLRHLNEKDSEICQKAFQCDLTSHESSLLEQFLESMSLFIEYTRKRMEAQCSPDAENIAAKSEQNSRADNDDRRKETQELRRKVAAIERKLETEEEAKKQLIAECRQAIELIVAVSNEQLNDIARRANEEMSLEWRAAGGELSSLQAEERLVLRKNEYQFAANLLAEKALREEKSKCERKLEDFIARYDGDLVKKQIEYETITHQQKLEAEELTRLTELFALQKPKYEQLMRERAIWQEKELAKKLYRLKKMLAHNTISKFLNNYVRALRENDVPIVITKKSKGKKKKTVS